MQQLVNHLTIGGKRLAAIRTVRNTIIRIKRRYGVNPIIILFEALEIARVPLRVIRYKRGRQIMLHLRVLQWWKQYALTLVGVRSLFKRIRLQTSASRVLFREVVALREAPQKSKLYKRKITINHVYMEARLQAHYR